MDEKFFVSGMTCSACSSHVEKAVSKVSGVSQVNVNLLQNSMKVAYDENATSAAKIIQAVEGAGYGASQISKQSGRQQASVKAESEEAPGILEAKAMKKRLILSICFLIPLLYIAMGPMVGLPLPGFLDGLENAVTFGMAQFLLTLAIMYLNRSYYKKGFKSLIKRAPTMDALIAIGSMAAVVYGIYAIIRMGNGLALMDHDLVHTYHMDMYFESAGTILTLITVGKYLESRSKGKTGDAIKRLMQLSPDTAVIERDSVETEIPIEQVQVNDILIIRPGSRVPVDGVVVDGTAAIDESAITGESLPVEKDVGSSVTGATVAHSGFLKIRAVHVGEDTTLSKIIRLVEEAGASKAPIARLADRVSGVFVPVVISIAVLATVIWLIAGHPLSFALSIGIAVLVISCPCALGLATPTAIMVGTGKGAEQGILYKSAESIETAHTVQTVVLDKTGTVTEGKPQVVGIYPQPGIDETALLQLAASIERKSEHPLAAAVVQAAEKKRLSLSEGTDFQQIPGQGIRGKLREHIISAGNARMMETEGVDISGYQSIAQEVARLGQTPLYFTSDGKLLGLIAIADTIKPSSKAAVQAMRDMGLDVVLLTGDNPQTAATIARQAGIDTVISGVLPEGKEQEVRRLQEQGKKVAMIGDGINDAPALTRADVGIAIGAGTDVAIESADIVLMKSDLMDAVKAIQLSHATIRNIKENLFWAFFYNTLGIPLAAGALYPLFGLKLSPMFASAAMSFSSVFVVTNALRLRFWKPKQQAISEVSGPAPETVDMNDNNNKGANNMQAIIEIKGMMCAHCKSHVEKALNALPGASASVDLEAGTATVNSGAPISNDDLTKAVVDAGYEVISIQA